MGGIGTKQKKHRENQKKTKKQKQQKKQYSRGLGDGEVPPRVSKYCFFVFVLFFLVFSMFFDFSPWGPPQRDSKYFFMLSLHGGLYCFFSVYGFKWWTDNLKSRQVERVLTKFKGCEPSCRKVQKVAALVGSGGGDRIYIYIYNMYI